MYNMKKIESFAQAHPDYLHLWDESNTISPDEVSKSSSQKITWKCPVCQYIWEAPVNRMHNNIVKKKTIGCLQCYRNRQQSTPLSVTDPEIYAHISPDNEVDISQITQASRKEIKLDLPCGHSTIIAPRKMRRKNGKLQLPKCEICQACSAELPDISQHTNVYSDNSSSEKEEELFVYVNSIVPDDVEILRDDKSLLKGKEIDILIPDYNIGIEFNDLYWHGESQGKHRNYHKEKYLQAQQSGVQLITIWEDDWDERKEIVKSMIAYKLGHNTEQKVYARKTTIKNIDTHTAREFMDTYHIQGYTQGSYYLGLYDNENTLVAVSIWRKNKNSLYLDRYATSMQVVGGMGKLLSYVLKNSDEWKFNEIVTFSDNEISDGGLYKTLGFEKDKELKPDYKYVVNKKRVHKFNYRRKRFKNDPKLIYNEEMSESDMAKFNGIDRVWDCGKVRWIMHL